MGTLTMAARKLAWLQMPLYWNDLSLCVLTGPLGSQHDNGEHRWLRQSPVFPIGQWCQILWSWQLASESMQSQPLQHSPLSTKVSCVFAAWSCNSLAVSSFPNGPILLKFISRLCVISIEPQDINVRRETPTNATSKFGDKKQITRETHECINQSLTSWRTRKSTDGH